MDRQEEFSLDKIQNIVEQLAELSVKRICLSGGEPFLRSDLSCIVETIAKNGITCDVYSAGIVKSSGKVQAISKGILMNLKEKGLNRIMFNLQALDEAKYDLIMGTKGQQLYLFASIKNAVESDIDTEIHFVPTTFNVDQIDKVLAYADSQNIKQVSFLKLVKHGRAKINELELSTQDENTLRKKLAELAKSNSKVRVGIPLIHGKVNHECHAINHKIYIKYDGSVYGCEAFKYIDFEDVKVQNVHNDSLQSIISDSEYFNKSEQLLCGYRNGSSNCPVQNYIKAKEDI